MRILVIRLSSLGDIILTLPALHRLRSSHPEARVEVAVGSRYADLLSEDPVVDRVHAVDPRRPGRLEPEEGGRWDLVVDLQGTLRSRWAASRAPARERRGVRRDRLARWGALAAARLGQRAAGAPVPVVERFMEAVGAHDASAAGVGDLVPRIAVRDETRERARAFLRQGGVRPDAPGLVAFLPGASHPVKAWPVARYVALGRELARRGSALLVAGGGADADVVGATARGVGKGAMAFARDGALPFLAALLGEANVAVSADSGLGHLAAAAGTPVVSLFGPTVPGFGFAPRGPADRVLELPLSCRPCSLHGNRPCRLGTHGCLRGLAPEAVLEILPVHG